jgi:8-oxo-dGTP diphosphatase
MVALTVDLAILTVRGNALQILLVERGNPPYQGKFALPGGFIDSLDEDIEQAAVRELSEETGLGRDQVHLEQLHFYATPQRDPRGRVVSICYLALMPNLPLPQAGGDARAASWEPVDPILDDGTALAFDHVSMVRQAVERARGKLEYTTLGAAFCPPEFTITELRTVYEVVWGQQLDPANFHRKVVNVDGFLVPTGKRAASEGGRPAATYRRGPAELMHPPILRTGK